MVDENQELTLSRTLFPPEVFGFLDNLDYLLTGVVYVFTSEDARIQIYFVRDFRVSDSICHIENSPAVTP